MCVCGHGGGGGVCVWSCWRSRCVCVCVCVLFRVPLVLLAQLLSDGGAGGSFFLTSIFVFLIGGLMTFIDQVTKFEQVSEWAGSFAVLPLTSIVKKIMLRVEYLKKFKYS